MIKISLDAQKQELCEHIFLEIMESCLPFSLSEIYGEKKKEVIDGNKLKRIEDTRAYLWEHHKKLYSFLYLASDNSPFPYTSEEARKKPVHESRLRQLLIGECGCMTEGNRRNILIKIIKKIGEIDKNTTQLLNIFNYKSFANSPKTKTLLKNLGITVCPYCNRAFTATIEKRKTQNGWIGARPQFDHYFYKRSYPYLAVNFYNLIPCCSNCNQYKATHNTLDNPMLYPYDEGMGKEYIFVAYPIADNKLTIHGRSAPLQNQIKIFIEPNPSEICKKDGLSRRERDELEKRLVTSVKKLHLQELYNTHTDYSLNIIQKKHWLGDAYIEMLEKRFPKMSFSIQDVKEIMYCKNISEEYWGQNILAKLTYDMDNWNAQDTV